MRDGSGSPATGSREKKDEATQPQPTRKAGYREEAERKRHTPPGTGRRLSFHVREASRRARLLEPAVARGALIPTPSVG